MKQLDLDMMTEFLLGRLDEKEHDALEAAIASGDARTLELLMEAEALVADLWLAECEPVEPSAGLHDRLFASIEPEAGFMGFAQIISDLIQEPLDAARAYLESLSDPDAWFPVVDRTRRGRPGQATGRGRIYSHRSRRRVPRTPPRWRRADVRPPGDHPRW
jgi:hypothetical protein